MYAPNEGVAHEWFEIFNNGTSEIDIEDWRFSDGSNHVFLKPPKNGGQGSLVILPGTYAIVAKEADTFLSTHAGFSSTVIDGSFSLTDTGDTLSLIDGEGVVVDTVTYDENAGARKNGLSLQLIDGVWTPAVPTPGVGEPSSSQALPEENEESQTQTSYGSASSSNTGNSFTVEPQIFAQIINFMGKDRVVTVGADTVFKGEAIGILGEKLMGARFMWNFGDGMRTEGAQILHYYRYPGEYIVTLSVSSGEYTASDRIQVSVREAKIVISRASPEVITIGNLDEYEIDLSWWLVAVEGVFFMLPEHTVILPQHEIHLSSGITGLHPINDREVGLQYPNGEAVSLYNSGFKKPHFENTPVQSGAHSSSYSPLSIVGTEVRTRAPIQYASTESRGESTEESIENFSQIAAVAQSVTDEREDTPLFWSALVGIVVLGSISALVLRRKSRDEITIIE